MDIRWLEYTDHWADFTANAYSSQSGDPDTVVMCFLTLILCGFVGLSFRSPNLLTSLVYGELILVGMVFGFSATADLLGDSSGNLYALVLLNLAAVESSIGMVLLLNLFKVRGTIDYGTLNRLRG